MPVIKDETANGTCLHLVLGLDDVQPTFGIGKSTQTGVPGIANSYFGFVEYTPLPEEKDGIKQVPADSLPMPVVALHFVHITDLDRLIFSLQHFRQEFTKLADAAIAELIKKAAQA